MLNLGVTLSHGLRFVGIIDVSKNTFYSKLAENKANLVTKSEEEQFVADLIAIKKTQSKFDAKLGKVVFTHVRREKVQQLVFQINEIILYVTCEPEIEHNTIVEISKLITDTIKNRHLDRLYL